VLSHAADLGKFDLSGLHMGDLLAMAAGFFTMALGSIPQQDVFQRVNSSGNEKIAVWGTTLGGLSYVIFAFVPIYLAYTALVIDPDMVNGLLNAPSASDPTQRILPTLVMQHMSPITQVIFFGALLSVIMSTASGTLLAPSVTFSENIVKGYFPQMNDNQLLWVSRATVVVFTMLVTWHALTSDDTIHQMVERAYRITLAGAFVPLVAGIFWKRANELGGALAVTFGLVVWVLGEIMMHIEAIPDMIEPQVYGLIASAIGMSIGVAVGARPKDDAEATPQAATISAQP